VRKIDLAILLLIPFAIWGVWFSSKPKPIHTYVLIRQNPAWEPLVRPTHMGGANPQFMVTQVLAERYEPAPHKDCYVFYFRENVDTLCGVIDVIDRGVVLAVTK
jgi:hypothetical protein